MTGGSIAADPPGPDADWKLKLRDGRAHTGWRHFTVVTDGVAGALADGFACRAGRAVMSMKAWAGDADEAIDMVRAIGRHIGFTVDGRVEVYDTAPDAPPGERPHGYDIGFVPYDDASGDAGEEAS